jgi:hypothetical protein
MKIKNKSLGSGVGHKKDRQPQFSIGKIWKAIERIIKTTPMSYGSDPVELSGGMKKCKKFLNTSFPLGF